MFWKKQIKPVSFLGYVASHALKDILKQLRMIDYSPANCVIDYYYDYLIKDWEVNVINDYLRSLGWYVRRVEIKNFHAPCIRIYMTNPDKV